MVALSEITKFLDQLLDIKSAPGDASNNGLQIEGAKEVKKVIFAVDACQEVFNLANEKKADFIFVHHGLSWGGSFKRLTGITANRLNVLFTNDISLYACHLPLDGHATLGHNAQMASMIELQEPTMFAEYGGIEIGVKGELSQVMSADQLGQLISQKLRSSYEIFGELKNDIKKVGIISGSAGSEGVQEAAEIGLDCLITGEVGHTSFHAIKEMGISVISLGHYHSETPGVRAIMNEMEHTFELDCEFVDVPTGL